MLTVKIRFKISSWKDLIYAELWIQMNSLSHRAGRFHNFNPWSIVVRKTQNMPYSTFFEQTENNFLSIQNIVVRFRCRPEQNQFWSSSIHDPQSSPELHTGSCVAAISGKTPVMYHGYDYYCRSPVHFHKRFHRVTGGVNN